MSKKQTAMQSNPLNEKDVGLDDRVDGIYCVLKGKINLDNLIPTCIEVAQEVENVSGLIGTVKLNLLQKVLRHAVADSQLSNEEKEDFLAKIDTVVPAVVEAAVLASKSPIVSKIQVACAGCWTKTRTS